ESPHRFLSTRTKDLARGGGLNRMRRLRVTDAGSVDVLLPQSNKSVHIPLVSVRAGFVDRFRDRHVAHELPYLVRIVKLSVNGLNHPKRIFIFFPILEQPRQDQE